MSLPPAVPAKRPDSPTPSSPAPLTSPAVSHHSPRDTEYSVVRQGGSASQRIVTQHGSVRSTASEQHPRTESPTPLSPDEDHSRLSVRDTSVTGVDPRLPYHHREVDANTPRDGSAGHDAHPTGSGAAVRFSVRNGPGNGNGNGMGVGRSRSRQSSGVFADDGGRYPQASPYPGQALGQALAQAQPQHGSQAQATGPLLVPRRSYTLLNEAGAGIGHGYGSLSRDGSMPGGLPGGAGWEDGTGNEPKSISTRRLTVRERLQPTLLLARAERDKFAARARMTGYALNGAIGAQVVLGSLTTGLSAALSGKNVSTVTAVLGGMSTLVASYLARTRGSNEPELSISRTKDLEQFIRECESFGLDFGHLYGVDHKIAPAPGDHNKPDGDTTISEDDDLKHPSRVVEGTLMERFLDSKLEELRSRFEALLGNASGERKLSEPLGSLSSRA